MFRGPGKSCYELNKCPAGLFSDIASGYVCTVCHKFCATCLDSSPYTCKTCNVPYLKHAVKDYCTDGCLSGTYAVV